MASFQNILATTDFSEVGDHALPTAFELAHLSGARVTLCHVVEAAGLRPNPLYPNYPADALPTSAQRDADARLHANLAHRIPEDMKERCAIAIGHGPVADEILRIASEGDHDLIVIATMGTTGLLERVMGGTAYKVVRHAHCPVLIMR